MSQPTYLWLCDYCKNNIVVFPVKTLNPNYNQHKCDCCGKKKLCRGFRIPKRGEEDEQVFSS